MVCGTSKAKPVWTPILGHIVPAVCTTVPATMWRAMAGRSPDKAIFLQDTAMDMNRYEIIVASLNVQGAFPPATHLLVTEVLEAMGLPFLPFMTGYIQRWLCAIITAPGLTRWTGTSGGLPQVNADCPFLYLRVTLPRAFELAQEYQAYAPYPLRSLLVNFADDNLLTTATRHRSAANAGLPTTTDQASAILQLTTTYLDTKNPLPHRRKLVKLADAGNPPSTSGKGNP